MSKHSALGAVIALLATGCGGGLAGTGEYCYEVDPVAHDFECEGGTLDVTVTNLCGASVTFAEPVVSTACVGVTASAPTEAAVEDGATTTFTLTYTPEGGEVWDCTVAFAQDLAGEPNPEITLSGGGDGCQ